MKVGFIGAGKVGFSLGKYLADNNQKVIGYYSEFKEDAKEASKFTNSACYTDVELLVKDSEIVFITVPDGVIEKVWSSIKHFSLSGKIICHTSGALSSEVFSDISKRGGFGFSNHTLFAESDKYSTFKEITKSYIAVEESEEKALRLERMIKHHLGYNAYWEIYHALLSTDDRKGTVVFEVLQEARKIRQSEKIMEHLGCPAVADVFSMSRSVSNEAHRYEEFIRFRELENGILFSEITPKAQILTCVADHFEDRFPLENWIIYDKTHKVCLVHGVRKRWRLVWGELFNERAAENISEEERKYEFLWKRFFHSVSIKERENPKCQQAHLPFRYRGEMTEFSCAEDKIGL